MNHLVDELAIENDTKIILLVIDGVGGVKIPGKTGTELQVAHTPHLDALAQKSECGLLDTVGPGITPGSGPAHFALFGYDPLEANIGRGVLETAGIGLDLTERDVTARINFATLDKQGKIIDRRAGRIDTATNQRICKKLRENIVLSPECEFILETVKEHRAVLVLRADGLSGELIDTDPQTTGVPPLEPQGLVPEAEKTVRLVKSFLEQSRKILADEEKANGILFRGFAKNRAYKSLRERFKLRGLAIANYPMYRGVAKLLGMDLHPVTPDLRSQFEALREKFTDYDFFFLHVKATDARGEDGDFDAKVKVIEEVDSLLPILTGLSPDVLIVTADHSTPALLKAHSWHPVPVMLYSQYCRSDEVDRFDEIACSRGSLGRQPGVNLMTLALANALRLKKFGA
ncbi:MAG: 2,3-bisphosphoglycerate-independent phosphoglycerate mutase [candidate division KSB1 bacterium]|nr:2,3-bisphosphoglycerate-independent phosphoglycerate mutase [candidate division KSB1 bacterium]